MTLLMASCSSSAPQSRTFLIGTTSPKPWYAPCISSQMPLTSCFCIIFEEQECHVWAIWKLSLSILVDLQKPFGLCCVSQATKPHLGSDLLALEQHNLVPTSRLASLVGPVAIAHGHSWTSQGLTFKGVASALREWRAAKDSSHI